VIHDWDDERAVAILKNCRDAMTDAGRLLVMERVIPPGNVPSEATLFDINMLVSAGGMERTEAEYRALLARAGFTLTRVISTLCPLSLIEAVRT
jgi:O-methyltransferase domain